MCDRADHLETVVAHLEASVAVLEAELRGWRTVVADLDAVVTEDANVVDRVIELVGANPTDVRSLVADEAAAVAAAELLLG